MGLGLSQSVIIELADHDPEWERLAAKTMLRLWRVFGTMAKDIQHIGSTSIMGIKAKPIIDIAVAVDELEQVEALTPVMEHEGFIVAYAVKGAEWCGFRVFADSARTIRTYNVHVVKHNGKSWRGFVCFRDYMNAHPCAAKEYETLKIRSTKESHNSHSEYKSMKRDYIARTTKDALLWASKRNGKSE